MKRGFARAVRIASMLAAAAALPALADDRDAPWGAIAFSTLHDNSYFVSGYPTQGDAEAAALASCREGDPDDTTCTIPLSYHNACGAIAEASDKTWGTGWGATQDLAMQWAVKTCRDYGGADCKAQMVVCSPGGALLIPGDG